MSTAEALDDVLGPPISDEELEADPPAIEDRAAVNSRLRRLRSLGAECRTICDLAQANRQQIDAWERAQLAKLQRESAWIERQVESFMRFSNRLDHRTKSIKLPFGTISLRAARARIEVTDPNLLVKWASEHAPRLIRTKVEADKTALAKLESDGGESGPDGSWVSPLLFEGTQVPGVSRVVPAEDSFSITLGDSDE